MSTTATCLSHDSTLETNGELVILRNSRLSFDALQGRLVTAPGKVVRLVAAAPASVMVRPVVFVDLQD